MIDLTYDQVSQLLDYDPETGVLTWKEREASMFRTGSVGGPKAECLRWNKMYAGKAALTAPTTGGYLSGAILRQPVRAHRVAWLLAIGNWPIGDIDHINGNTADNRLCNLRDGSTSDNMKNQRLYKNNRSGTVGVSWRQRDKQWAAYVNVDGKRTYLGQYRSLEAAIEARAQANSQMGFSDRHGL